MVRPIHRGFRMTTTYETLLIEKSDGVAVITLNRPTKRNAMNPTLHRDMAAALEQLRSDDAAKVIVITGAGDVFCAGMDLKEFFIARKIAGKDVHALRATKDGYHFSLEMTWEAAMNYSMAKELELVQRQGDAFRKEGIKDFMDGKYKPGLETHPG